MVLPRIKNISETEGFFSDALVFDEDCVLSAQAMQILSLFMPAIAVKKGVNANINFLEKSTLKKGAYELLTENSRIIVNYSDYEGVRNAMSTLAQLYQNGYIKCCKIFDEPDNPFRSCMLDLARGYVEIPVLKEHIMRMALLKYNHIHLHLMDRQSYVLQSEVVPNPVGYKQYTKQEMRGLADFCKLLGLEVIPEIEIPAHAVNQIKALPELACELIDRKKAVETIAKVENARKREFTDNRKSVSGWVVCAGKERTYEIYEKIVQEVCEVFDGKYLHIGGDELEFQHLGAHPHWENCVHCQKRMAKENIKTVRELYYYVIKRMYDIVTRFGKKMMLWNDQLDVLDPIDIPKDIIVEYWNGEVITKEKGILQKLLEQGFEVINAHYHYTYVDFPSYMQEENIKIWNTKTDMLGESEVQGEVLGGEMCAWELGNPLYSFYPCSLPVCMVLFADRVWNNASVEYEEEYKNSIFAAMTGYNGKKINPFVFFKEIIPPRDINKNMLEQIEFDDIDERLLSETVSAMQEISPNRIYGKFALQAQIDFLNTIKETI